MEPIEEEIGQEFSGFHKRMPHSHFSNGGLRFPQLPLNTNPPPDSKPKEYGGELVKI